MPMINAVRLANWAGGFWAGHAVAVVTSNRKTSSFFIFGINQIGSQNLFGCQTILFGNCPCLNAVHDHHESARRDTGEPKTPRPPPAKRPTKAGVGYGDRPMPLDAPSCTPVPSLMRRLWQRWCWQDGNRCCCCGYPGCSCCGWPSAGSSGCCFKSRHGAPDFCTHHFPMHCHCQVLQSSWHSRSPASTPRRCRACRKPESIVSFLGDLMVQG